MPQPTIPLFNPKHLVKFKREMRRAGGFDELMRKKLALETKDGMTFISKHKNIEEYKQKFLIGAYATLRPYYKTEIPYTFWSKLFIALTKKVPTKI